jgi:hypothetical protein
LERKLPSHAHPIDDLVAGATSEVFAQSIKSRVHCQAQESYL